MQTLTIIYSLSIEKNAKNANMILKSTELKICKQIPSALSLHY